MRGDVCETMKRNTRRAPTDSRAAQAAATTHDARWCWALVLACWAIGFCASLTLYGALARAAEFAEPLLEPTRAVAPAAVVVGPPVMREGREVRGPRAFYALCARSPELCRPGAGHRDAVELSEEGLLQLRAFNRSVNAAYAPMEDRDAYGASDFWTLPRIYADCEDYVLAKREGLIAAGWPPEALLIGVVRGRASPYHAVLIVRTTEGELVLDNLTDAVLDWRDTGYEWVIRQSKHDLMSWVRVENGAGSEVYVSATADR